LPGFQIELRIRGYLETQRHQGAVDESLEAGHRLYGSLLFAHSVLIRGYSHSVGDRFAGCGLGTVCQNGWAGSSFCRRSPSDDRLAKEAEGQSLRRCIRAFSSHSQKGRQDVLELWLVSFRNKNPVEIGVHQGCEEVEIGGLQLSVGIGVISTSDRLREDGKDSGQEREKEHIDGFKGIALQSALPVVLSNSAHLHPMHEEAEEQHKVVQLAGLEFGDYCRDELGHQLCDRSTDSRHKLGKGEARLVSV
jgi:hypothetical protein